MVDLKEAFGPLPMSVVAIVLSTISLCLHAIKRKDEPKPEQPVIPTNDVLEHPADKQIVKVNAIIVDKNGIVQVVHTNPRAGRQKINCSTMLTKCCDSCPLFKQSITETDCGATFSCNYQPYIYEAGMYVKSKRSKKE